MTEIIHTAALSAGSVQICILHSVLLPLLICLSSSTDVSMSSFPHRRFVRSQALLGRDKGDPSWALADVRVPDPEQYSKRLDLFLVESATSWLEIRWQLDNSTGATVGVPKFSRVRCYLGNITMIHNIFGPRSQYRIPHLLSNTNYLICVEIMEEPDNYLHYNCSHFSTIPIIRPDSIVGMVLAVGYVVVMSLIGYVSWWLRVRKHSVKNSKAQNEIELRDRAGSNRSSEIEEHVYLNAYASQASPAL